MYLGFQTTADALISKFGRSVSLLKPAPMTFDPETGLYPADIKFPYSVNAIFVGISSKWKDKFVIEEGDAIALVSATGEAPEQNDILDGWRIIAVEKVQPASVAVIYKCHVRKQ